VSFTPVAGQRPTYVRYEAFTGLNTKTDPHVITRRALQQSVNMWNQSYLVIGKRPGNINFTTAGATGSGAAALGVSSARDAATSTTNVMVYSTSGGHGNIWFAVPGAASFTKITTNLSTTPKSFQTTQMFDPQSGAAPGNETVFITDGVDNPQMWIIGGTTLAAAAQGAGKLPTSNISVPAPITPKYCSNLIGQLFYAGEPTEPSGVYISDVFQPENFTLGSLLTTGLTPATYIPYLIGRNDGIAGGNITGIKPLGNAMIVYKQSAVYRMDYGMRLFGDTVWSVSIVSVSTGAVSPGSITAFDGYHAFLGMDGVYITDGTLAGTVKISKNVPTLFDGPTAQILNRQTAVGCRMGNKYIIFYDDGLGSGVATGYPTRGAWFDFDKPDEDGLPSCGEIAGMTPIGLAEMRGPKDGGNFVWANAAADQVGMFAGANGQVLVYSDFTNAIQSTFQGKSDWFTEFDPGSPQKVKTIDNTALLLSIPAQTFNNALTFTTTLAGDVNSDAGVSVVPPVIPGGGLLFLSFTLPAQLGLGPIGYAFQRSPAYSPQNAQGHTLAVGVQESSINPWNLLGYEVLISAQEVSSTT
jgi:hypothetical protein